MALKVSKPGDAYSETAKLSKFGKGVMLAVALIIIGVLALIAAVVITNNKKAAAGARVMSEIDRAGTVCTSAMSTLGNKNGESQVKDYISSIAKTKKIDDRINIAQEMIAYSIKQAEGNQGLIDELNGVRNRIFVAQREYTNNK